MDIRKLLERDHREVEEDFRALERADYEDEDLIEKIILELTLHTEMEERVFYPALDEVADTELVDQARAGHDEVRDLIAELRASPANRRGEVIERMKNSVLEHVEEEESELFPIALAELGLDRLAELGELAEQVREEFLLVQAEAEIDAETELIDVEVAGEDFRAIREENEDLDDERQPER